MKDYPQINVTINSDVLLEELGDEAVLLSTKQEHYFGLDQMGIEFWKRLQQYGNSETVAQTLLAEYDVDEPTLQRDIAKFILELESANLVTVENKQCP